MTFVNNLRGYSYIYSNKAKKSLKRIDFGIVLKIDEKLKQLISGQHGLDVKKLTDTSVPKYRLRVGNYRVIYEVFEERIVVIVVSIDHRQNAYKNQE